LVLYCPERPREVKYVLQKGELKWIVDCAEYLLESIIIYIFAVLSSSSSSSLSKIFKICIKRFIFIFGNFFFKYNHLKNLLCQRGSSTNQKFIYLHMSNIPIKRMRDDCFQKKTPVLVIKRCLIVLSTSLRQ